MEWFLRAHHWTVPGVCPTQNKCSLNCSREGFSRSDPRTLRTHSGVSGKPGLGPPREVWLSRPSRGGPSLTRVLLHCPSILATHFPFMAISPSHHMPASSCLHIFAHAFCLLKCLSLPSASSASPLGFTLGPGSSPMLPVTT